MERDKLISKIKSDFKGIKLRNGIGLWEAQGLDDRLTIEECKKLRNRDEKEDWSNISVVDLYKCNSSLSFFDAQGMLFHLPILLLFALDYFEEEEDRLAEQDFNLFHNAPDIEFHLLSNLKYLNDTSKNAKRMRAYHQERFSLLNKNQIECIIKFLEYRLFEIESYYQEYYVEQLGADASTIKYDTNYIEIQEGIEYWNSRLEHNTL